MFIAFSKRCRWLIVVTSTAVLILLQGATAQAQGRPQFRDWKPPRSEAVKLKLACGDLKGLTGYEFSINTATVLAAGAEAPEQCRVTGQILPDVRFELSLPASWNRRLYMMGNGGFAGQLPPARSFPRDNALKHGFAVAATDTGHDATLEPLASFAVNRQKVIDYAYRAVHVTAMAARQIMQAYYDAPIERSYFDGCSTGGRQGLMSAQRFPQDFDGIVVGAPVLNQSGTHIWEAWIARALKTAPIAIAKVKIIANKVYANCDGKDGLVDGLIDDPRRCTFRPVNDLPKCSGDTDGPDCFTAAQIGALEKIYGDVMSKGKRFFPGLPLGAEVFVETPKGPRSGWDGWVVRDGASTIGLTFAESFLKYMAFAKPDPNYNWTAFNYDTDLDKMQWITSVLDATDPDLSRFKARGGKILMYFGWADPALNALMGLEYYEQVVERVGPTTTDFFRLFMVPGMFHCGGGVGVSSFDAMTPLMDWVEKGVAPAQIIGSRMTDGKVIRSRPLCLYPQVAKYKGSGSIDEASNFTCANP